MKIKNLFFILIITLVGFIGLNNVKAEEEYELWVNGEEFTNEKTTINCGEGTATFDSTTNTLTLDNATINSTYEIKEDDETANISIYLGGSSVKLNTQFTIVLNGANTINTNSSGILTNGSLNITGNGTLTINQNFAEDPEEVYSFGSIYAAGLLKIKDVSINIITPENQYSAMSYIHSGSYEGMDWDELTEDEIYDQSEISNAILELHNTSIDAEESLNIIDSTINISTPYEDEINSDEYDYESSTTGIYLGGGGSISGNTNISINGVISGIYVAKYRVLTINSGNINIHAYYAFDGEDDGYLDVDDYKGKILGSSSANGENATILSKSELEVDAWYYGYILMGDFETYKITNASTNYIIDMPKETIEGEKIGIYNWYGSIMNIESVKILKTSDNTDVTEEVGFNTETNQFIMPAYPVTVKVTFKTVYAAQLKSLSSKLDKYNAIKLTWSLDDSNSYAYGYSVYYRKAGTTSWTKIGWTAKNTYTKTGLTPGVKYNFKVVPMVRVYNANDKLVNIESTKYKIVSRYTLKKMNLPTVTKYNNSKVQVKWTKVEGATKYQIARSVYKTRNYSIVKTVGSGYIGFKVDTKANKMYYYKVRACNGNVCAPWSNYRSFRLK